MFRLIYRLPLLLLHLFIGLPVILLCFMPLARSVRIGGRPLGVTVANWWARMTCSIFGLELSLAGQYRSGASLVVANHISWLDIPLLYGTAQLSFVSKDEVKKWPLVGWVASASDTVFHQRGSHDSASGVSTVMAERLRLGRKVAIFPEGGILPGHGVNRFHARLYAAAINSGSPVQPVMIRYLLDGRHCPEKSFMPGEHFMANVLRLLRHKNCTAEVSVLPSIDPAGKKRRELAMESELAVRTAFESEIDMHNRKSPDG